MRSLSHRIHKQGTHRFAIVDTPYRLRHQGGDREYGHIWQALFGRYRHRIGGDDLYDIPLFTQPLNGASGKETMRADDGDTTSIEFAQAPQDFDDCAAVGDLVINDDDIFAFNIAYNSLYH